MAEFDKTKDYGTFSAKFNSYSSGEPNKQDSSPKPQPEILDDDHDVWHRLGITKAEFKTLLELRSNGNARIQTIIFLLGVFLTPITAIGALLGFVHAYQRILWPEKILPHFYPMRPIIRLAMFLGAILLWVVVIIAAIVVLPLVGLSGNGEQLLLVVLVVNFLLTSGAYGIFHQWQKGVNNAVLHGEKFGTARFARQEELEKYKQAKGLYIGGEHYRYSKQGHLLTIAGSRSGKFTNLIAPNLLGWADIDGSFVVIDPKGEIAACTSKYQGEAGQNVVVLNPWAILPDKLPDSVKYNPMDILDADNPNLVDDCQMLAEMIVPQDTGKNKFFSDSARAILTGLIMYIALSEEGHNRSLKTLWKWVRYPQEMWDRVLAEMENFEGQHGDTLLYASTEIAKYTKAGSQTWGSILATVMQSTDFLKSPALQVGMESGYDPYELAKSKTTVYVIIPTDKLQSHGRWLRLVTTSMMRAVIRKPGKRVVFMLDEFAALGYLPEIETALAAYAGYNVTVWAILQSLVQLQALYQNNWQVFIGNTAVRHFFGIHNNFDANYISAAIGQTSNVLIERHRMGIGKVESNQRPLITPDELRIASGKSIFTFIDDMPPTYFDKAPYHDKEELKARASKNPYL
ncbi:type IV secretory system conjugative DNA transfer family protein [Mucilaginibacter celer]|uniref:Type IV secretory system conjugative DNA transfer family protein n=1 Tax=Mucilaginibacter celer TaxID=2305508 RepID=A0A494VTE6_9SPHI|nr:type IV secretory system conjugative DNA transfer family protein [Mucilaginibacter celer]AYL96690.1 type IV secretory system conjugative DNA transfer family protein [Mucilaginibacter celer]